MLKMLFRRTKSFRKQETNKIYLIECLREKNERKFEGVVQKIENDRMQNFIN
jgi:hypothetical protein